MLPLRINPATSGQGLRDMLAHSGFTERELCQRLEVVALDSVDLPAFKTHVGLVQGDDLQSMLTRLFVFGHPVHEAALSAALSSQELNLLLSTDLLRLESTGSNLEGHFYAPVRLVPVDSGTARGDILLAGDRTEHPDGSRFSPAPDIVFSGHNPLSRQFLRVLPRTPAGRLLDLCTGTGVAALALAPYATTCVAVDVAERSVHFTRFNAWLNDVGHLSVACGDLYGAVQGQRFDRIVAHPPYVPSLTHELTYRDGGETGEAIVRGIVSGAPAHLEPGGTFHLLCLGMDTSDGPFEQRVRGWLGDAGSQFDIIFALDSRTQPERVAAQLMARGGAAADLAHWRQLFERVHVREFVYGALVGRRRREGSSGEPFTRRVVLTEDITAASFDWLFAFFDAARTPGFEQCLLTEPIRLHPAMTLEVRHRIDHGLFVPTSYTLSNNGRPFLARLDVEPWVVALLNEVSGERTVIEVFRDSQVRGRVPEGFAESTLAGLIAYLAERGCIQLGERGAGIGAPAVPPD